MGNDSCEKNAGWSVPGF